jgi:hypothetical protein
MVTPPQVTHISRLPTESEFDSFVRGISGGKLISKLGDVSSSIQDPRMRQTSSSFIASLSKTTVQVDLAHRKYSFVVDVADPSHGSLTALIIGFFTPDGGVVQLNAYSRTPEFAGDVEYFTSIADSFSSTATPSPGVLYLASHSKKS